MFKVKFYNIPPFMGFQQPFTAYGQKNKSGFHLNFGLKGQIRDATGLSMHNTAEKKQMKGNPERVNPEPVEPVNG